jgi:integrase
VKDQLGHSSIQVTVDVYGHLIPGANRKAVDRLDDVAIARHLAPPTKRKRLRREP